MSEETLTVVDGDYEMFVREIVEGLAYCDVVDGVGQKSYMEIPVGDLERVCNERINPGLIFGVEVRNNGGDINFSPIERPFMSKEGGERMRQDYEEKYGDV